MQKNRFFYASWLFRLKVIPAPFRSLRCIETPPKKHSKIYALDLVPQKSSIYRKLLIKNRLCREKYLQKFFCTEKSFYLCGDEILIERTAVWKVFTEYRHSLSRRHRSTSLGISSMRYNGKTGLSELRVRGALARRP